MFCVVPQGSFTTTLLSHAVLSVLHFEVHGIILGTEREMEWPGLWVFVMWYCVFCERMTKKVHA